MEATPGRDRGPVRDVTGNQHRRLFRCRDIRHRGDERTRVGVTRRADYLSGWADFYDPAEVDHSDAISVVRRDGKVVSDHEHSYGHVVPKSVEYLKHLSPDGDVQHGHWLIRDNNHGIHYQRCRDRNPLPLAARQLVREPIKEQLGRIEAHLPQRCSREILALDTTMADPVRPQRLVDDGPHPLARVERFVGVLVDELHLPVA